MPAPGIVSFGDGSHVFGETGLSVSGAGFGPFPGELWIFENADRSGAADQLTVGNWNDLELTGVEIPASPNNTAGTRYLALLREDLAWSQTLAFTLSAAGAVDLSGVMAATSGVNGSLGLAMGVSGQIAGQSGINGALGLAQALQAVIAAESAFAGELLVLTGMPISGVIASTSAINGDLAVQMGLAGVVASESSLVAALYLDLALSGQIDADSALVAELTGAANATPSYLTASSLRMLAALQSAGITINPTEES